MTPLRVRIAVCTYLRPDELRHLLPQLLRQAEDVTDGAVVDVLVIDNDPDGGAKGVVAELADERVGYEHEPTPGIAAARNRALSASEDIRLLAFIDDDEEPHDGWLRHLVQTWRVDEPALVSGRVVATFDGALDPWLEAGQFFTRRNLATGTELELAAAGNVLIDLDQIRALDLRFDLRFGLTGGEDTMFSRALAARGGRMVWCAESIVTDRVPRTRMTRAWVLERARSHGTTTSRVALALAPTASARRAQGVQLAARGTALIGVGAARAVAGRLSRSVQHQAKGQRQVWRGRGLVAGARGRTRAAYGRDLTVLQSFPKPRPTTNPYVVMVGQSLAAQPGVTVLNFSWRTALTAKYDVFHVHWPEILVEGASPVKTVARQGFYALLMLRLRARKVPLVRTKHNVELPSGIGAVRTALLRWGERWTTLYIRLNPTTPVPDSAAVATIAHGHYRDWFAEYPRQDTVSGRLAYVGQVRGYKGVEQLLDAFAALDRPELALHVAGRPTSDELAQEITARAATDNRVSLRLEHLSDADLVNEVTAAELVVLPYRFMHNSGGALAVLSLDRPILVPDNEVNRQLQRECGPGWVHLYAGDLTPADLAEAVDALRAAPPTGRPELTDRDWDDAAQAHVAAYQMALSRLGRAEAPAASGRATALAPGQ